ncbi:serine/threonine-protein kinase [Nostoc sp.]|uniref:serine/threonine-protein kinase n=1 Tax=Nostoc sp. TaxID=1180 RepID=UPI002FF7B8A3
MLRNRYRPIKTLGGGGFGKTYLAEDIDKLNEHCVIKQFAPQVQGTASLNKATELFEQEAKRLQQLGKHPQIPTLLAYFDEDNRLYLVQEFIEGQNLLDELKQQGIFNEQKIRELLLDLLEILKTVHQQKVIHRDIKPENIIRRSDEKLVLIDFGISKQLTMTVITNPGTTVGSRGYAPREQMEEGQAYPASDLYSIGATCFHLLSGIHPWILWQQQGYGWVSSWGKHLQQPVSHKLEQILDALLQKEYQQRYQSVEEVSQSLNSPSPASVRPTQPLITTLLSPLQKQFQQNTKLKKRLLVGLAITLVALIGTQVYGYIRYGLFFTNPIFLVESFPSSFFLERTLIGHSGVVRSLAISPDGKTLASSGSGDNTIKVWDLSTGKQIRTLVGHTQLVYSLSFISDGKMLVSVSGDNKIKLWNLATAEQIRTLNLHSKSYDSFTISPDSTTVATSNNDANSNNIIELWNLATGKQILTFTDRKTEVHLSILSLAISPDGKILASSSMLQIIKLWNLETGEEIRTFAGHTAPISSVAFSRDGKTLASGSDDNIIKLWNIETGQEIRTLTGHTEQIFSIAFSPDGKTLASASIDKNIKLWNLETGEEIRTLIGHSGGVLSVAFSPDGKTLISGSVDRTIKIWRLK